MIENEMLEKYARLVVEKGVNVQKDQPVFITVPIEGADFGRLLVKYAYEAGAKDVHVHWVDDALTLLKYEHAAEEVLQTFPAWEVAKREAYAEAGGAFISVYASNPDLLQDIDPNRVAMETKAAGEALTKFRSYLMNDEVTWTVVSIPTVGWAKKIFPEASETEAVEQLWHEIVKTVRIDEADPVKAWNKHNETLKNMREQLNEKRYKKLILTAAGTHLEVGLPEGHIWHGGAAESKDGTVFNPNMPTEEVFSMPHKYEVNGKVSSTKPLHYGGNVINNFTLTFKDGAVVDYQAEEGEEVLAHLLKTDDGAKRLGEIALVPHESPISQSGIIFYNTLFDENASCHLALGKAYPTNIEGGAEMDAEQFDERGVNDSVVHVDFMIGSADMNIEGVFADGRSESVFEKGTWAAHLKN
ncbi:MAG TPA: aminopeptidase [Pseudogracilibacillus sp.]|nr:aminopeptidase [Pseudogracilibacillus sp.]